eukprot:TRINITY_DN23096_c0_g1_i1.p1 TRINITY_DN23096_c0_g1~~TRINITY_DN23096_c0_g1_i1.p1  ORF type:complete len:129 (+),score=38.21 TRINITY_DN23096_c0_g1_i1:72-458(+)
MFHCREAYEGGKTPDGKRMHGEGVLTLASGNQYRGYFNDGRCEGEGVVHFKKEQGNGQYRATWKAGIAEKGDYVFSDGLEYALKDWDYCTQDDRRLWKEHLTFITPAMLDNVDHADVILPDYGGTDKE